MKKWLAAILLCISIACSFIPCSFEDCCDDDELTSQMTDHESEPTGGCSPFFSCTTCPGFIEIAKSEQLVPPMIQKQVHHTRLFAFQLPDYTTSFWQPPRSF